MPGQNADGQTEGTQLLNQSREPNTATRMRQQRFVLPHTTAVATTEHTNRQPMTAHNINSPISNY
jgi:hypothetical protein